MCTLLNKQFQLRIRIYFQLRGPHANHSHYPHRLRARLPRHPRRSHATRPALLSPAALQRCHLDHLHQVSEMVLPPSGAFAGALSALFSAAWRPPERA